MTNEKVYEKYLIENNQFYYDEQNNNKPNLVKQDNELFHDEDDIPGESVRVLRVIEKSRENWKIVVNGKDYLVLKGSRFLAPERAFLRSPEGNQFIIDGARKGWKFVSEFKRQIRDKI